MSFNLDEFVQKYDVHPETVAYLRQRAEAGGRPFQELGIEGAREASLSSAQKCAGTVELDGTETYLVVPATHAGDGIPVTIYKPTACDKMASPTIVVYYHGGGNILGSRKTHETVCKIIARDTPCIVITVEYRVGPEHTFPANNDDARDVVDWIAGNKTIVDGLIQRALVYSLVRRMTNGSDPDEIAPLGTISSRSTLFAKDSGGAINSKLGVSGDSAGGRLAAVVCHERRKLIDFAVLIYPNVSMRFEHASVQEFKTGPSLSWAIIEWLYNQYGITSANVDHPRASVLRSKDFSGLPPTLIIVAELDPLRDGCYAYYEKLKQTGNGVQMTTIKGVPHGFWHIPGTFRETCQEAYRSATDFIRKFS